MLGQLSFAQDRSEYFLHTSQENIFEDYYNCVLSLYDGNGDAIWNVTWENVMYKPGIISENPKFIDNNIVLFVGEILYSIDIESGEIIWEQDLKSQGDVDFQISSDCIYLSEDLGEDLRKIDKNTGEILWSNSGDLDSFGNKEIRYIGDIIIVELWDHKRCAVFDSDGSFITYKEDDEIFNYLNDSKGYFVENSKNNINDDDILTWAELNVSNPIELLVNNHVNNIEIFNSKSSDVNSQIKIPVKLTINDNTVIRFFTNGDGIDTIQFFEIKYIDKVKLEVEKNIDKIRINEIKLH